MIVAGRRRFLTGLAALLVTPWARGASGGAALAGTWKTDYGYQVGILEATESPTLRVAIDVPTRAHGLLREPGGTLLAVARRPGDWLLRWDRDGRPLDWCWIEPRRAFTGHVIRDGHSVYTCETNLDTGAGLIGVRDAQTLEKRDEWVTHGCDPHQLLWDSAGTMLIANGGIATLPETGRVKRDLARMDSSLVRLAANTGECLGQWRLADQRLSLRHLAWSGRDNVLGIALQAEHDDAESRARAPVLALFDGNSVRLAMAPRHLAGYGGDIVSAGNYLAVSCPRAQTVVLFTTTGEWVGEMQLAEACALAATGDHIWAGGHGWMLMSRLGMAATHSALPGIRLDNHWVALT